MIHRDCFRVVNPVNEGGDRRGHGSHGRSVGEVSHPGYPAVPSLVRRPGPAVHRPGKWAMGPISTVPDLRTEARHETGVGWFQFPPG